MKALLLLAVGAVLMFCLIVLLVSGVLVVRNEKPPKRGGESHQPGAVPSVESQRGRDLTPPPSQRIEAGARPDKARRPGTTPTVSAPPRADAGAKRRFPSDQASHRGEQSQSITQDCAGQTGHNFGPCPGDPPRAADVQALGDGGAAAAGDGGGAAGGPGGCK